jgi:hypothetical protein
MELTVLDHTVLKPSTDQASTLPANVLIPVEKGKVLPILAYLEEDGHLKITLDPEKIDCKALGGKNTHWIYGGHIEDPAGFGPSNNPKDTPPAPAKAGMGTPFTLPGYQGRYWSGSPVHKDAEHVSWGEALHFNGASYRAPENAAIVNNIIQVSKEVQKIRDMYGKPVRIHSFFRDSATNKRVGGARFSQHTLGSAVDFSIPGVPVMDIYRRLDPTWPGGLAYSTKMGFVHLDIRNRISGGGRARWAYPGG